jgi:hypothetical protein
VYGLVLKKTALQSQYVDLIEASLGPTRFWAEIGKMTVKFRWKCKAPRIATKILKKKKI